MPAASGAYDIFGYIQKLLVVAFGMLAAAVIAMVAVSAWHYRSIPDLPDQLRVAGATSGRICSPEGEQAFLPLTEIPPLVRNAVLAAEDADFYSRPPINPLSELVSAVFFGGEPDKPRAISTVVARCLMSLDPDCCRGLDWHIRTAITLYRLERDVRKDRIFEIYLNEIRVGHRAYGVSAAADIYFGVPVHDLTVDQIAYIAAILKSPSYFGRHADHGTSRRNLIIDRMAEAGVIGSGEAALAKRAALHLRETRALP